MKLNNSNLTITIIAICAILVSVAAAASMYYLVEPEGVNQVETPEMVQDLVAKAIKLYDEKGTDAFSIINDDPEFHGKQLYVYVFRDSDGIIVAQGADKSYIGSNLDESVDANGKNFGKDIIHDSATKEGVWVQYPWMDPVTQKILPKSAWIVKHDGYIFGSGIYDTVSIAQVDSSVDLVGDDRDEYGCIPSAGYSWNEEKQECTRAWEDAALIDDDVLDPIK